MLHILERTKQAKTSRDKAPFREMANRLQQFWSHHLSFGDEEFWQIVDEELKLARKAAVA